MATVLLVVPYLVITTQATTLCTSGDCNIDCNIQNCDTVICTDTASSCVIKCDNQNCKQSQFYLSASNSNMVHCIDIDSCQQITIQCGISNSSAQSPLPVNFQYEDFDGDINECIITLPNNIIRTNTKIECHNNVNICQWKDDESNAENDFQCIGNECITGLLLYPYLDNNNIFVSFHKNLLSFQHVLAPNETKFPSVSPTKHPHDQGMKVQQILI